MAAPISPARTNIGATSGHRFRPSFFFWMAVVMNLYVFIGFGLSYLHPIAKGTLPYAPPVVHLHALVHFAWMIMLVTQPLLANVGKVALHRSLGNLGIAIATGVVFTGGMIALLAATQGRDAPQPPYHDLVYLGIMAVTGFGILFALAIHEVRRPQVHKRLILLATLPILPPAVHRAYQLPFGITDLPVIPMYITLDAMAAAIVFQEWRATGRINGYTLFGVAWLVVQQALHFPVTHATWFAEVAYVLTGMMHYR